MDLFLVQLPVNLILQGLQIPLSSYFPEVRLCMFRAGETGGEWCLVLRPEDKIQYLNCKNVKRVNFRD